MSRLEDFANVLQKFFQTCYKTGVNEYARGEERKDQVSNQCLTFPKLTGTWDPPSVVNLNPRVTLI